MENTIGEMLASYGLTGENNIFSVLPDFPDEEEVRGYCWKALNAFPGLKKENWHIGIDGGDYIYSFEDNYIFITDDIWSFNLIARQPVLELLAEKIKALRLSGL